MTTQYQDLEFDKIKLLISERCHSLLGRQYVSTITPLVNIDLIRQNLELNHEIQTCLVHGIEFSFEEIVDIKYLFADDVGAVYSYEEFLNIYYNVYCANQISDSAKGLKDYPRLYGRIGKLHALPEIERRFKQIFDFEGMVLDTASAELSRIRKQMNALQSRIARMMNSLMQDAGMEKYLQDKFVTQRNDRYVIPIKESAAPYVKGIVQSRSATKSTIFIEPENVVPLSNELQLLRQEEKNEIYKIFLEYTGEIRAFSKQIIANTAILAELDMRFAIGRLGKLTNSRVPQISNDAVLELYNARHPLLIVKNQNIGSVIPYDLTLGKDYRLLILSGPNTGGKTVLLKSVGLITLMALSGLPVPVSESSVIGLFGSVFADIGDDQSIENALSTFSSHIDKIRRMLESCDDKTLILIDEIGAATDPQQGSALAQVILEHFQAKQVKGIFTTHYTSLKVYAEQAEDCINASMQFDLKSLIPTYKFTPGFPGDSFAIEVAASLGLDPSLISRAKELCGSQSVEFTELLKQMASEKKKLGRELYEYQLKNHNLQARIDDLDKKNKDFEAEIKQRKQQYMKELQKELIALQKAYTNELNDIRSMDKEQRKTHSVSKLNELQEKQTELSNAIREFSPEGRQRVITPKVGEKVWLPDFETDVILLEIKDQEALVDMNGISFKTPLNNLYLSDTKAEAVTIVKAKSVSPPRPKLEIKLLGLTFDEAQPIIDEAIDEAIVAGMHSLRIVHGKGTGALRTKIRSYLNRKKQIISISTPDPQAGGSGVTIASF